VLVEVPDVVIVQSIVDIYSLPINLWNLLPLRLPFSAGSMVIAWSQIRGVGGMSQKFVVMKLLPKINLYSDWSSINADFVLKYRVFTIEWCGLKN
jgi:hypothetical protein